MATSYDWVKLDQVQWLARQQLRKLDASPFNHRRIRGYMAFVTELMGDHCSLSGADIIEIGSSAHQPFLEMGRSPGPTGRIASEPWTFRT